MTTAPRFASRRKRREFAFQHIRTTGPMLPADVLSRVAIEDSKLPGLAGTDYGLAASERLGEAITRSWTRLLDIHRAFSEELAAADPADTAAAPTFKAWLRYLFQELGYGSLTATPTARVIDDSSFPVSHQWKHLPVHLVGANVPLDRRTSGVTGASKSAPHSLAQEFLNRSDEALWAIVSNGRQLRLLRDNVSMTRQAFAEFDLEGIFKGQSFSDTESNPALGIEWNDALRESEGTSKFLRESGRFPLCGVGDINTFAVFSELNRVVLTPTGRAAFIVPAGIATDDTTKAFFDDLVSRESLAAVYQFENEDRLFAGVHHSFRFVIVGLGPSKAADLFFFARQTTALADKSRHFTLTPDDFALLNPNTRTCPTFRSLVDAELNKYIYRRTGVLWDERKPDGNPWDLSFMAMFHMANDSGLFRSRADMESAGQTLTGNVWDGPLGRHLPLVEAKMVNHFDHRFSTYEGATQAQLNVGSLPRLDAAAHADPHRFTQPDYWVAEGELQARLAGKTTRKWLLGWRDICRNSDQRTVIASLVPAAATGDTFILAYSPESPAHMAAFYAGLCSFVVDYLARQKVGGTHLKYNVFKQLPIPVPGVFASPCPWSKGQTVAEWLLPRVLELTYTSWDLEPFARDCGYTGPPYGWDEERRFQLRCELDAAFFRLYLGSDEEWARDTPPALREKLPTPRHVIEHIMDSFPIVKRKDEEAFEGYRTKASILASLFGTADSLLHSHGVNTGRSS